jgi:uncharacterized protein YjbI with pentapeptide repeats
MKTNSLGDDLKNEQQCSEIIVIGNLLRDHFGSIALNNKDIVGSSFEKYREIWKKFYEKYPNPIQIDTKIFASLAFIVGTFDGYTFKNCDFKSSKWIYFNFLNCHFEDCDFSSSYFLLSVFRNSVFNNCNFTGFDSSIIVEKIEINNSIFFNSKIDINCLNADLPLIQFKSSKFKNVKYLTKKVQKPNIPSLFTKEQLKGITVEYTDLSSGEKVIERIRKIF